MRLPLRVQGAVVRDEVIVASFVALMEGATAPQSCLVRVLNMGRLHAVIETTPRQP